MSSNHSRRATPANYETKFADFIRLCEATLDLGVDTVIIGEPWVLGDNYEEVIESLSRLQKAGLKLMIAG